MLSIKDKVSAIIYVKTFITKLANQVLIQVLNRLINGRWDVGSPTKDHLFSTLVDSI